MRKATLLPVGAREIEWVRYIGDNFEEIEQFVNRDATKYSKSGTFYLSLDDNKELYWKEHGFIRVGDFVVAGMRGYRGVGPDGYTIISWKEFPRMISEDVPIFLDEYREWLKKQAAD